MSVLILFGVQLLLALGAGAAFGWVARRLKAPLPARSAVGPRPDGDEAGDESGSQVCR